MEKGGSQNILEGSVIKFLTDSFLSFHMDVHKDSQFLFYIVDSVSCIKMRFENYRTHLFG